MAGGLALAYAVSLSAFLSFTLPCLLPAIGYLFWGGDQQQQGWGWLGLAAAWTFLIASGIFVKTEEVKV